MAGKTRSAALAPTSATSSAGAAPRAATSNQDRQQKLDPAAGGDAGLAQYERALGEFLGRPLYAAVSRTLSAEAMQSSARAMLDAAFSAASGRIQQLDGATVDAAAADALVAMLREQLEPTVNAWLATSGEALRQDVAGWAGASPRAVASVALMAAVAAVVANLEVPALKRKLALAEGLDAELDVELGRLQALTLKKLRASLSWTAGPLLAAVQVDRAADGATEATATAGYTAGTTELKARGVLDAQGLKVAGLSGAVATDAGSLRGEVGRARDAVGTIASIALQHADGPAHRTTDFRWDGATGTLSLGHEALTELDGLQLGTSARAATDGSGTAAVTARRATETGERHGGVAVRAGPGGGATLQAGASHTQSDLKASFDAELSETDGVSSGKIAGRIEQARADGHTLGASLDAVLAEASTLQLAAWYGFQDPGGFRRWLLEYQLDTGASDQVLKTLIQDRKGDLAIRAEGRLQWGERRNALEASVHGAWFQDEQTAVVAGARYEQDLGAGTRRFTPEVGVQHKGIQVLFGYESTTRQATLRLGLPF